MELEYFFVSVAISSVSHGTGLPGHVVVAVVVLALDIANAAGLPGLGHSSPFLT